MEAKPKKLSQRMGGSIAMDLQFELQETKKKVAELGALHDVDKDGTKFKGEPDALQKAEKVLDKRALAAGNRANSIKIDLVADLEKQKRALSTQTKIEEDDEEQMIAVDGEMRKCSVTAAAIDAIGRKGSAGSRRPSLPGAETAAEQIVGNIFFLEKKGLTRKWVARNVVATGAALEELTNGGERRAMFELREVYDLQRKRYDGFAYTLKVKATVERKEAKFVLGSDDQALFEALLARLYAKRKTAASSSGSTRAA